MVVIKSKECIICNSSYNKKPSQSITAWGKSKCCGQECHLIRLHKNITSKPRLDRKGKTYEEIYGNEKAQEMLTKASERMSGKNNYFYKYGNQIVNCSNCNKELIRIKCRSSGNRYCNAKCQMEYQYKTGITSKFENTKKAIQAMQKTKITKPQKKLFENIKQIFPDAILNSPIYVGTKDARCRFLDVYDPKTKLVFEYDCSYWHNLDNRDEIRDAELKEKGLTVIHYVDYVPTVDQLKKDLQNINAQIIYNTQ